MHRLPRSHQSVTAVNWNRRSSRELKRRMLEPFCACPYCGTSLAGIASDQDR